MKRWTWPAVVAVFFLLAAVLVGCSSGANNNVQPAKKEEPKTEQAAFPVTVKDGLGEDVTIKAEPKKEVRAGNVKAKYVLQIVVAIAAVVFIILGVYNGSAKAVYTKAANICTECIGLG